MTGRFPSLCDRSKLSSAERQAVQEAEKGENLRICMTGRYPSLCNRSLLSPTEASQVASAERNENLRICMDGRYPSLCNKTWLSPEQRKAVATREAPAGGTKTHALNAGGLGGRPRSGDCESGHWIESVSGNGKVVKLEDGSLWQVSDLDVITSSLWLPISDVIVCGNRMINTDDGESVEVTRLTVQPSRTSSGSSDKPAYLIQASSNDEIFVINGEVFKAKTYCFGMEKGDKVVFVSGSASGACSSAEILNLRTSKVCRVWCE